MQGNLSHISFTDLLLLATTGKKSGVLKLVRGKETVEVYLTDGKIVHATCPIGEGDKACLLYTSPSPRDRQKSRMPSSA